ncbi:hypothetical protein AVEN_86311-1, partial [Araneus ventricosus]
MYLKNDLRDSSVTEVGVLTAMAQHLPKEHFISLEEKTHSSITIPVYRSENPLTYPVTSYSSTRGAPKEDALQ